MKTNKIIALFAAAIALIACEPTPAPVFEPALSVDNTETISVPAAGADTVVNVSANVSWTAVADQDFVTITPASVQITDKTSNTTPVTISVAENEGDARTANVTITAEGCEPVVIVIEQGEVVVPPVFDVLDNTGEQPAPATIDVPFSGATNIVYVNSNIDWTATSSETWLTVNPASYTAETKVAEPVAVTIAAAANAGAARTATVTFAAAGQQDVVITVNQALASTLEVSVANITYQTADVTYTSSSTTDVYFYVLTAKTTYEGLISKGHTAATVVKYFLDQNAAGYEMTPAEFLALVGRTETSTVNYTALPENTDLIALAVFFDTDANPIGDAASKEFKTASKPVTDQDYLALLGTYTFNALDYYATQKAKENVFVDGTLVVEEGVVNETFKISIPGIGWCPEQGQYIDRFECPWDKVGKKSFTLVQGTIGDEGYWDFGDLGMCDICLDIFFYTAETDIEGVVLTADQSGNLSATSPAVPARDYLCLQAAIVNEGGHTGYANGILIFTSGMNFTKQVAPAVKNAVQHSVFEMPRILKNKQFNANKVSGKLSIR